MKKHLEYKDEKSHKFWAIEVKDNSHTVTYGKVGTKGRSSTKAFDTAENAQKDAEKLVKAKIKKSYAEISNEEHYNKLMMKGGMLFHQQKYKEAIEVYKILTEIKPEDIAGWQGMGICYSRLGDYEKAIFYNKKVIEIAPDNYTILSNLGSHLNNLGQYEEALLYLNQSIAINDEYYHPYYCKACVFSRTNRLEEAISMIKKVLELSPSQFEQLENEPDFENIRNSDAFKQIFKVMEEELEEELTQEELTPLDELIIRTGKIITPEITLLILEHNELVEEQIAHSELAFWIKDKDWFRGSLDYNAISAASKYIDEKYTLLTLGDVGDFSIMQKGTLARNIITKGSGMASTSCVKNKFIAVGINGKVFDVTDINNHIDLSSSSIKDNIEACCEYPFSDFLVCGWKGLIATYNNGVTEKLDSSTDVILTDIISDENGKIYACGQRGTIVCGTKDLLKPIALEGISVDFWSIKKFKGEIYVASTTALYKLVNDEKLELVTFGEEAVTSFYHLDTFEDSLMLSVGKYDAMLFDGTNWERVL